MPDPTDGRARLIRPTARGYAVIAVAVARQPEVGARGAVLFGAEARGKPLDAQKWTEPESSVEPDPSRRAFYDDGFRHQMELLDAIRPTWHTRAALATAGDRV